MRHVLTFLCAVFLFCSASHAQSISTRGTEFWLTFMENWDTPDVILYVSAEEACQVTVMLGGQVLKTVSVGAKGSERIDAIPKRSVQTTSDEICRNCAIRVTATKPISVYAYNSIQVSTDASIVLPSPALGDRHVIASYPHHFEPSIDGLMDWSSLFAVVGVEDNTEIEIVPSAPVASQANGELPARVPIRKRLNKGDVIQYKTPNGFNSKYDLTGTSVRVVASGSQCGKIAVFSGHQRTAVPWGQAGRDHLFEQMPPNSTLGREHIVPALEGATYYDVRVITAESNTTVNVDGQKTNVVLANSLLKYTDLDAKRHHTVDADKPVMVVMYGKSGTAGWVDSRIGDPMMVVIPPIDQRIDNVTVFSFVPNAQTGWAENTFITVLTPTAQLNSLTYDGYSKDAFPLQKGEILATTTVSKGLSSVVLRVEPGVHTIDASENGGLFALVHGLADYDSYGFVAGASYSNLRTSIIVSSPPYCPGRPITFTGFNSDSLNIISWRWIFHDGKTQDGKNAARVYSDTGTFNVKLVMQRTDCGADTAYYSIRITNPLQVSISAPASTCADSIATLDADVLPPGSYMYTWTALGTDGIVGPANGQTVQVRHQRAGVYKYVVLATDNAGCSTKDTVDVAIIAQPTITVTDRYTICEDEELVIAALVSDTAAVNIRWTTLDSADRASISSDPTKSSITVKPRRTGEMVFVVRAVNSYGCTQEKTVRVTIVPRVVVTGTGASKVFSCLDDALPPTELGVGLSISGGVPPYRYEWKEQGGGTSTFRGPTNGLTALVKPKQTTTYVLTVHDSNQLKDCPATVVVTVELRPVPDAKAGDDAVLCACDASALATLGIDARCGKPPYTYTWTPSTGLSNPRSTVTAVTTARPTRTTTYVLAVSDVSGITNYDTVSVNVEPCPDVSIAPVAAKCGKDTVYRISARVNNGVTNVTYLWEPSTYLDDPTSPSPDVRVPSTNGSITYKVTVKSQYGCTGTAQVQLQHSAGPRVTLKSDYDCSKDTLCRGDEVRIDATVTGGLPSYSYRWSSRPEVTPGWTSTDQFVKLSLIQSTKFYVTATDSLGCSSTDSIQICVDPVPNVKVGTDTTICASDIASVQISRGQPSTCGKPPFVYQWSPAQDLAIPDASKPWNAILTPKQTTTYTLRVIDDGGKGLSTTDSIRVTVRDPIALQLSAKSLAFCPEDIPDSIVAFPTRGSAPYLIRYIIDGKLVSEISHDAEGVLYPTQIPRKPGIHTIYVDVRDANGCVTKDSVRVEVYQPPTVQIKSKGSICLCDSLTIEAVGTADGVIAGAGVTYKWSEASESGVGAGTSLVSDTARVQIIRPTANAIYYVEVTDRNGCTAKAKYAVNVNYAANSITLSVDSVTADPKKQEVSIPIMMSAAGDTTNCAPDAVSFALRYREELFDPFPRCDNGMITGNEVVTLDSVRWRTVTIEVRPVPLKSSKSVLCTLKGKALLGAPGFTVLDLGQASAVYKCDTFAIASRDGFMQLDSICITQDSIARLLDFDADGILSIYPNPATSGSVDVQIRKVVAGSFTLSVVDIAGRTIEEKLVEGSTKDIVTVRMQVPILPGMYRIVLKSATGMSQRSFIVISSQ